MRTIHRVSAAFLVLDGRDKSPLREASILTDGTRVRCIRKGDGYFVCTGLPETAQCFEITAPGFCPARRTLLPGAGTLPEVVVMQCAARSPRLSGIDHYLFRFRKGAEPLANASVQVTLRTGCGALRVVDSVKKGQQRLTVSGGYAPMLLYQEYDAGAAGTVVFTGYDRDNGCYALREPPGKALAAGAALYPRWTLETSREGMAVLPGVGLFMQREELEFCFETQGTPAQKLTLPPPAGACPVTVTF